MSFLNSILNNIVQTVVTVALLGYVWFAVCKTELMLGPNELSLFLFGFHIPTFEANKIYL